MNGDDYNEFEQQLLRSSRQDALPAEKRDRIAAAVCRAVDEARCAGRFNPASGLLTKRLSVPLWVKVSLLLFAGSASAFVAVREKLYVPAMSVKVREPAVESKARSTPRRQASEQTPLSAQDAVANAQAPESVAQTNAASNLKPPGLRRVPRMLNSPKAPGGLQPPTTIANLAGDPLPAHEEPKTVEQAPTVAVPSLVAAEVDVLQKVRAALLARNAPLALARLKDYSALSPKGGILAEEADTLRIDALLLAGDQVGAARAIEAFLASRPNSGKTDRLRALMAAPMPKQ